jgi:YD repeat-containing protein
MVNPQNGELFLEVVDASLPGPGPEASVRRVYRDGRWHWTLQERLIEDRLGFQLNTLEGSMRFLAAAPLPEKLASWPVGTRLEFEGIQAERESEGWALEHDGQTTLYGDGGWPVWRRDNQGNRIVWERSDGRLKSIARVGGQRLELQFDGQGHPSVVKLPSGAEHYLEHVKGLLIRAGTLQQETRYAYDDAGRLQEVVWADLSRVQISRDPQDRVSGLLGPGPLRMLFRWGDNSVEVRTGIGAPIRVSWQASGYAVQDAGGSLVRVQMRDGLLAGWEDPTGSAVRLQRDGKGHIKLVEGTETWRFRWRAGQPYELTNPAGAQWLVERSVAGELRQMVDPDGRTLRISREGSGEIRAVDTGATPTRFEHDSAGRLTKIHSPNGAVTRLAWTGDRLKAIDPAGQELTMTGLDGRISRITSRLGDTWEIHRDALNRPTKISLPDGQVLVLQRNSLGRLGTLQVENGPEIRYGWRSDGALSRLTDSIGATTRLDYDPSGLLVSVSRPDGSQIEAGRDARGELISIAWDDQTWQLARDPAGRPTALGPLSWAWDLAGQWLGWAARGVEMALVRTGAGAVREIRWTDGDRIGIDLDPTGRTSRVRTAGGTWALERDPSGLVRKLSGPGVATVEIARDDRGLVTLLTWGQARRRVLRDAAGRPVKWTSSEGVAFSVHGPGPDGSWLGRFPSGALAKRASRPGQASLELLDPGGKPWLTRTLHRDGLGRTARVTEAGADTVWRWDPLGELVAVETREGAWSWLPGRLEGPGGHVVLMNEDDRPTLAIPPVGLVAWGLSEDRLVYFMDEYGRINRLTGDEERPLELEHDPAGRLKAVLLGDGSRWALSWDPFGRLIAVVDPAGGTTVLGQGPDGLLGWTRGDRATEFIGVPGIGWIEATGESVVEVLTDETGSPRIVNRESSDPIRVTWGPTGMPDRDPGTPVGWQGTWSLFPGGPMLDGAGALDPVTGARTDPGWRPAWWPKTAIATSWPGLDSASRPWWDPGPWVASTAWRDPLAILVALGELEPLVDPDMLGLNRLSPPLPWLPIAAALQPPPLSGRAANETPVDPLVTLVVRSSISPTEPLTTQAVLEAVLSPEWQGLAGLQGLVENPETWWTSGLEQWLLAR